MYKNKKKGVNVCMIYSQKNLVVFFVVIVFFLSLLFPFAASAQLDIPSNEQFDLAEPNSADGIKGVIIDMTKFLAGLLGGLAILVIVVSGILYITSGGDESRIESAKRWLIYAIIGLIVALLAWVIVATVAGALGAG